MTGTLRPGPFDQIEAAELRRLVYRAFALRGDVARAHEYREALEAIETWYVETLPERLRRARRMTA
jgi:hypothetical protein